MSSRLKEGLIIGGIVSVLTVALVVNLGYKIGADDESIDNPDPTSAECASDTQVSSEAEEDKINRIPAAIWVTSATVISGPDQTKKIQKTDPAWKDGLAFISYRTKITQGVKNPDGSLLYEEKSGKLEFDCPNLVQINHEIDKNNQLIRKETKYEITFSYYGDCVTKPPEIITLNDGNDYRPSARKIACTAQRDDAPPKDD